MNLSFENKVVLITGAASGLGLATAKAFAESGASVVLAHWNKKDAQSAAQELANKGHKTLAIACDVADDAQVESMVKKTVSTFGRIDAAYNNAGVQNVLAETADTTREDYDRVIGINLRGVWSCMKFELQQMRKQGSGTIVNCSSLGGLVGGAERGIYHAAKHGVIGFTKSAATCVCGSDLWPYRGIQPITQPTPMGHEYCGIVEEVGSEVTSIKPGQFVIGSFFASDNTCPNCQIGYQSSCQHAEFVGTAQAPLLRVPLADGTLVTTPDVPSGEMVPSLLALSDVMGTGWFAADAANVKPGSTVVVVGDGAVGLLGVLSAKQMGAERIIAMSRHQSRQKLAREFGATDIVTERGVDGMARVKELTRGIGADSVLECVGTQESMMQAITSARKGGYVSYVGVPHGVELDGEKLFYAHVHLHGGPAPVRRYLPDLIRLVWNKKINPGKVFDLTLPLDQVAEGYRAMDERRAIKALLRPTQ